MSISKKVVPIVQTVAASSILAIMVGLFSAHSQIQANTKDLESIKKVHSAVDKIELKLSEIHSDVSKINTDVAVNNTNIKWIKDELESIKREN